MPPYIHPSRMANFSRSDNDNSDTSNKNRPAKGPSSASPAQAEAQAQTRPPPSALRWRGSGTNHGSGNNGLKASRDSSMNSSAGFNANAMPLGSSGGRRNRSKTDATTRKATSSSTPRPNGRGLSLSKLLLPHQQRERAASASSVSPAPPPYSPYLTSTPVAHRPARPPAISQGPGAAPTAHQSHSHGNQATYLGHPNPLGPIDFLHVNRYSLSILAGCAADDRGQIRAYDPSGVCIHYLSRNEGRGGLSEREACEKSFGLFSMCGLITGIHAEHSIVFINFDTQLAALKALNLPKRLRQYDIGDFTFEFVPVVKWCSRRSGWRVIQKGVYDLFVHTLRDNDPSAYRAQELYSQFPNCAEHDTSLVPLEPPPVEPFAALPAGTNILPLDLEERPQFVKEGNNKMRISNSVMPAFNPAFFGFNSNAGAPVPFGSASAGGANPHQDGFVTLRAQVQRADNTARSQAGFW